MRVIRRPAGGLFSAASRLGLLILLFAAPAAAWEPEYYGVEYQQWTDSNSLGDIVSLYAVKIDSRKLMAVNWNGYTAFWVTPESYTWPGGTAVLHRTSDWAEAYGLEIAVNGTYMDLATSNAWGPTVSGGAEWVHENSYCWASSIVFGIESPGEFVDTPHFKYWLVEPPTTALSAFPWAVNVHSSYPRLVENGAAIHPIDDWDGERTPRTAVGISEDNRYVYIVVVDSGERCVRNGMGQERLADVLAALDASPGIHNAFGFDGGGSSALYTGNRGVVNAAGAQECVERAVINHMGVQVPSLNVEWTADAIPATMTAGVTYDVTLTGRNPFGPWSWTDDPSADVDNLAIAGGHTELFHVAGDWLSENRVKGVERWVNPGESYDFAFKLKAPDAPGTYLTAFHMVRESFSWYGGEIFTKEVRVVEPVPDEAAAETPPEPQPDAPEPVLDAADTGPDAGDLASDDASRPDDAGETHPDEEEAQGGCGCRTVH
jgi:hypothetical protein